MLENSRMTQTDQEIAGSARFFRSLLGPKRGGFNGSTQHSARTRLAL